MNLPIFPLPVFLLPHGITRLRIFEPRYLKMVPIASKLGGFIILPTSNSDQPHQWGSWVEIINFDQGDDGILEIVVSCKSLVAISSSQKDQNDLLFGDCESISHWSQPTEEHDAIDHLDDLANSLKEVFENNSTLNTLYQHKDWQSPEWVLARWLEILPIKLDEKVRFVDQHCMNQANGFVHAIITK